MHADRPITLLDILSCVVRQRVLALSASLIVLVVALTGIYLYPKKYESEAKLFVRLGRESVSVDPAATTGQTISIQETREAEINSIVDMLKSRELASQVVNEIGAERILKKYAAIEVAMEALTDLIPESGGSPTDDDTLMSEDEVELQKRDELAIKEIAKQMKIDSPKKSTTISIVYRARTPHLAQEVVQAVIDGYANLHFRAHEASGSLEFFQAQFDEQERIVTESQDRLREAKNQMNLLSIQGKQSSIQEQLTEAEKKRHDCQAELAAAKAKVEKLEQDLKAQPEELTTQTTLGIADNANDTMRAKLYELEMEEKSLASKYEDEHPALGRVRAMLASSRAVYSQQSKERPQNVRAINPVRLELQNKSLAASAELAAVEAKRHAIDQTIEQLGSVLQEINKFEVLSEELQRKIDIAKENHRIYARKLEESRINNELDQQSLSNVSVVQDPTLILKHTSPKRALLIPIALVMSMVAGTLLAVARELVWQRYGHANRSGSNVTVA